MKTSNEIRAVVSSDLQDVKAPVRDVLPVDQWSKHVVDIGSNVDGPCQHFPKCIYWVSDHWSTKETKKTEPGPMKMHAAWCIACCVHVACSNNGFLRPFFLFFVG